MRALALLLLATTLVEGAFALTSGLYPRKEAVDEACLVITFPLVVRRGAFGAVAVGIGRVHCVG